MSDELVSYLGQRLLVLCSCVEGKKLGILNRFFQEAH